MGEIVRTLQLPQSPRLNRFINDKDLSKIVREFGTPVYVIDEQTLHRKVKELLDAYRKFKGSVNVAYSIKANFNPAVLKTFMKDGIMFDATSTGELYFHNKCKGKSEDVIYTSVTEELDEYEYALRNGIKRIVVSSYNGLLNLIGAAKASNVQPLTMIRINPEVGVKAEVRASYRHGKFGVPFNGNKVDSATNMVREILANEVLKFEGFHFHLGSQITDYACFSHAIDKVDSFITKMKKEHGNFQVNTIDIGGGTPVFYGENVPAPGEIASSIIDKLNMLYDTHGSYSLIIESGRYLTAESCILISKIVNTKEYANDKFIIVDAGYHVLLDSALLKQEYPQEIMMVEPKKSEYNSENGTSRVHLAGRLCDTYDVFPISKASQLSNADLGKYVLFYNVGAYSIVFNMPFHCQTKPPVITKNNGQYTLVRKATTIEHLFNEEGGNL